MDLYLFNPDHDLALANNSPYYLPPVSARQMATDLAALPAWILTEEDSMVAVPDRELVESWKKAKNIFPEVKCVSLRDGLVACHAIRPWGWNAALVQSLKSRGFMESLLPDAEKLSKLRLLSSRMCAVEMVKERPHDMFFCGTSWICRSLEEIDAVLSSGSLVGRMLLKAPWSGSGKGLRWVNGMKTDVPTRNWCRRILATQQAVVVEPAYRRVVDFAMEFSADGKGRVSFLGYSLFQTDVNGAYKSNRLLSDKQIVTELAQYLETRVLEQARAFLLSRLGELLQSDYEGYLGVDMMVCRFEEEPFFRLHPCVEINLRMNMGVVAHRLYRLWLSPESEGVFKIDYFPSPDLLQKDHRGQKNVHPLIMRDGRIESGYVSLTPIGTDTLYRAAMWVHPVSG